METNIRNSPFLEAIANTAELSGAGCPGLSGIESADRTKIVYKDPRKINGSLNIDSAVKNLYPNDSRWDYAISYNNQVCYFEVHPATDKEINKMHEKFSWLKQWLKTNAPEINRLEKMSQPYRWIPSGKTGFLSMSSSSKKIASLGLNFQIRLILE